MRFLFILLAFCSALQGNISSGSSVNDEQKPKFFVTCKKSMLLGRLGDHLLSYTKAKWFAYKYGVPFLYCPFKYSSLFHLDSEEKYRVTSRIPLSLRKVKFNENTINRHLREESPSVFFVPWEYASPEWESPFEIGTWKDFIADKTFLKELRHLLTPRIESQLLVRQPNSTYIALHIRRGTNFDTGHFLSEDTYSIEENAEAHNFTPKPEFLDQFEPYKFPPLQYYLDQLKAASQMYNNEQLVVVLFTDHSSPTEFIDLLQMALPLPNITYELPPPPDFEKISQLHSAPTIESTLRDLLLMTQCDCLIRSGSNFAQVAQLLGNFELVFFPHKHVWYGSRLAYSELGYIDERKPTE